MKESAFRAHTSVSRFRGQVISSVGVLKSYTPLLSKRIINAYIEQSGKAAYFSLSACLHVGARHSQTCTSSKILGSNSLPISTLAHSGVAG